MRHGFTLIELMIVIAIIAIIAAIAIPNLLESRITANEAQAAASLKAGIFPGQTAYQAGSYMDLDGDGRGCFANHVGSMSGGWVSPANVPFLLRYGPPKPLSLLDPKFANQIGTGNHQPVGFQFGAVGGGVPDVTTSANVGAYDYYVQNDLVIEDNIESYWGATACPHKTDGSEARRAFGINATGSVLQSKQTITNSEAADITIIGVNPDATLGSKSMYATSPGAGIASPNATYGSPFQK